MSVEVSGKILRWGNSYAIRLRKADVVRAGLREGMETTVRLTPALAPLDLTDMPSFRPIRPAGDDDADAAAGLWSEFRRKMDGARDPTQ